MAASRYDFSIERGTSFKLSLTYKDSENVAISLIGYCARLIWKTSTGSTKEFSSLNLNPSEYYFTIDEPNGKISFYLPAETTNNFDFNAARYDLELQSPNDIYVGGGKETTRILYGSINIVDRFSSTQAVLDCA